MNIAARCGIMSAYYSGKVSRQHILDHQNKAEECRSLREAAALLVLALEQLAWPFIGSSPSALHQSVPLRV